MGSIIYNTVILAGARDLCRPRPDATDGFVNAAGGVSYVVTDGRPALRRRARLLAARPPAAAAADAITALRAD